MLSLLKTFTIYHKLCFVAWRSVLFGSGLLNDALQRRKLQFFETTIGLRKLDPRYNECVTLTTK